MDDQTTDTTTEDTKPVELAPDLIIPDEREHLMAKARMMGVEFSNNIGTETLKERIRNKLDGIKEAPASPAVAAKPEVNALEPEAPAKDNRTIRQKMYDEQMKLVRLRVTNLDPKKKDLPGEVFTVANEYLGTVRKFVPFGEVTDGGYHVPYVIYQMMKDREFLSIRTRKGRNGQLITDTQYVREFALEILDPLTKTELAQLATAQQAAGSIDAHS